MYSEKYYIDEQQWKESLSKILITLIQQKEVTMNKVANEINIDPKTFRNYVEGKNIPTAINLQKIAEYFEVSTDFLVTGGKTEIGYSDKTILELATILKNFNVRVEKDNTAEDSITLKIKDKVISMIIKELYHSSGNKNFDKIADKLAKYYGKMKVFNHSLVDYATFHNLIRHEYIYHDLEDDIMECVDENGNNCLGIDPYTFEEIEKREAEWEQMTSLERESWWENYCKN